MEQWDYSKDFTRFEYENELITLCLLNWEEYLSYLPSLFVFDMYSKSFKKVGNGYNDDDNDDNDDENENVEVAENEYEDEGEDEDKRNRWKMISKSIKRDEEEKFSKQYNEDEYFRDKELNKLQKNRLKELYGIREQKNIDYMFL